MEISETFTDGIVSFTLPARNARGRILRIDNVLDTILAAHDYPPAITHLLAEALVVSALIGSLLKDDDGQMTMQAQTEEGVVRLMACDYRAGKLRGYVDFDGERLAGLGANPSLFALFGKGYLAITFDRANGEGRYQGIVPLEGATIAQACEKYFLQSEQVPTMIKLAIQSGANGCCAGGILMQYLPDGEEGRERLSAQLDHPEWEHISILANSAKHEELIDPSLSLETIIWRLYHEEAEIRIQNSTSLERGCRCSAEHYQKVISRFPEAELAEMRDEEGVINVDCAFCSKIFPITL